MPRASTTPKTKLMFKERGGKAQVAFRDALGLSESEDLEFQKTKQHLRALIIKHFEMGLKPKEQGKHRKDCFLNDVYKAYPVFRRENRANAHLLIYVDRFLQAKAVPSSRFHKTVRHDNDDTADDPLGDDAADKSDNVSECALNLAGSPYDETPRSLPIRPWKTLESQEERNVEPWLFNSHGHWPNVASVEGSPSPTIVPSAQAETRSLSPNPYAAMPVAEQQTTFHKYPCASRTESTSQTLFSDKSVGISSVKAFLRHTQLGHLLEELVELGINTRSRLHIVAAWPDRDIEDLLRDSVRESRIDRFEALQLHVAFRSLRSSLVSVDFDDTCHLY